MSGTDLFLCLLSIAWGVLCLVLFFKVWIMTNDVKRLTEDVRKLTAHFCQEDTQISTPAKTSDASTPQAQTMKPVIVHDFKVGEKLTHKTHGGKLLVVGINDNRITCDRGWFYGIEIYDASELKRID